MKPMLAGKCSDITMLNYPVFVSPKLDGIRAMIVDGVVMSRKMIAIPNLHIQKLFGKKKYEGLDGELIIGASGAGGFLEGTDGIMRRDGQPDVYFHVFDDFRRPGTEFRIRYNDLTARVKVLGDPRIVAVPHVHCGTADLLSTLERDWLAKGFEGVMLRAPMGPYKFGRSTEREGWLLKLKQFEDSEAQIIGFQELMHNDNEKVSDAFGNAKRSSHKANKRASGLLGAFKVRDLKTGVEFDVGTGLDAAQREAYWRHRNELKGAIVKYSYFPTGSKEKPRFPTFLGFRDTRDF